MTKYQYQPLNADKREIRILYLHPGGRDDPIHISIQHIPFNPSKDDEPFRVSKTKLREIRQTLPDNWNVYSTIEGRPIFAHHHEEEALCTSWQSPIPTSNEACSKEVDCIETRGFEGAFEAVSYTWGAAQPLCDVGVLDTQTSSTCAGTCSVGPNLLEILIHLRRLDTIRALWIDAICINQDDPFEKGEQVRRMYDIFKFASRTVIWLGQASFNSTEALQALEHLGKQLEYTSDDYFLPAPNASNQNWWQPTYPIPLNLMTWESIAQLMQRPYFERLWVVQEVQTANADAIIHCGETEVSWYYVRRAFIRCRFEMPALPQFSSPSHKREQYRADFLSRSLSTCDASLLFRLATDYKCADPRDKVFAILGLLHPSLTRSIKSSYALAVQDVYTQAFLATVHYTRRLSLLDITYQPGSGNELPSWLPDLRQPNNERHKIREGSYASASSAAHASFQSPNKLHVCGIAQGEVRAVSSIIKNHVRHSYPAIVELVISYLPDATEGECMDWCVWIMTQGHLSERWHGYDVFGSLKDATKILQRLCAGEDPAVTSVYRDWYTTNLTSLQPGRLFVTDKGQVGCGPSTVMPGDKVYVALGYDYPILLRPTRSDDHSTCYNHLGPTYVHGLMEGQALLGPIPPPWKLIIKNADPLGSFSFINHQTDEIIAHDPRLDTLPQEWHEVEEEGDARLAFHTQHYKNKSTGEIINSDPRLLPEALEARGVHLETITLV
jgi:hypothetical protein